MPIARSLLSRNTQRVASASGSFDFTVMSTQDPLSNGGQFSNDTQGVGGNTAPNILSSMRVIAAFSGGINIAAGDSNGQDSPFDYRDSFAFIPGIGGANNDFDITATIYIASGYDPQTGGGAHELEILLGCSTGAGTHEWMECNLNTAGGADFIRLSGPANGFTPVGSQIATVVPTDGMTWRVTKVGTSYTSIVNGTTVCTYTGSQTGLGNGAGIAAFRRTTHGEAANKFGFRTFIPSGS